MTALDDSYPAPSSEPSKRERVEALSRPILVEPSGFIPRQGHRPILRNGELAAACDHPMNHLAVADHFEERIGTKPCPRCFPNGFPFTYDVEEFEPYGDLGPNDEIHTRTVRVPAEFIPDGDLTVGEVGRRE